MVWRDSTLALIGSEEEKRTKKTYDREIIRWLLNLAAPYKRLMALSLIFMLLTAGLELLLPYITKVAVDSYIYPAWKEARFGNLARDREFESDIKRKYPASIIELEEHSYLIDTSEIEKEDKTSLERLGYVTGSGYLVVDLEKVKPDQLGRFREILSNNPGLFKSAEDIYYADYRSLEKLPDEEISLLRSEDISKVGRLALILFISLLLVFVFSSLYTYILNYSGQKIMHQIRMNVFSHVLSLPQPFFDKNPVGRLTTRITNDVNAINEMYTSVLVQFFKDIIVVIGVLGVMFYMNQILTLFVLVLTILLAIVAGLFRMRLKTVYRNVRKTIARLNAFVQESIRGIVLIKLYIREKENFDRFKEVNRENFNANMDQLFTFATFRPIIEFISIFAIALILWYGGLSVLRLELTLGALLAYLAYIRMLFGPIVELAEKYNIFQSASAASENLYDLMQVNPEERTGRNSGETLGRLEFKNVWFSYTGDDWVLKDVSFHIEPGETVALVGLTGSGKTTIVNLVLRFYEIQKGEILLDGEDIRKFSPEFLRANVAAVFQDLFLFGKDISDGRNGSGDELLELVSTDDLERYGDGFISSGEKQLVSLRKAFSRDVRFLILDEATSHIDAQTELKIQEAVKRSSQDRTTLIIAHRLSNVREADRIIVIHKGEVFESGTHAELMAKRGIYYNLHKLQTTIYQFAS